jgi:ATP-dependent RNA helicase DDX55/SPB4
MPELKSHLGKLNFTPAGPEVDIYAIPYKDHVREKARQLRLAAEIEAGGKNAKRIKAERRATERSRNAEASGGKKENSSNPSKKKKRGRQQQIFDEWDDLAKEERLHKKLKQGKITKKEYNRQMYGGSGSEDETESVGSDAMP